MKSEEYKSLICEMIEQINDETLLRRIYLFLIVAIRG